MPWAVLPAAIFDSHRRPVHNPMLRPRRNNGRGNQLRIQGSVAANVASLRRSSRGARGQQFVGRAADGHVHKRFGQATQIHLALASEALQGFSNRLSG
jgi:hypothetical protein